MFAKPQKEHHWLEQMVGEWNVLNECTMPDGTASATKGKMICRSFGGMWLICENTGDSIEGDSWSSIMTLGFDPKKGCYVGTFVGSMMTNIWHYAGNLDATEKRLLLETEGPAFTGVGTCKYRDTIEIVDADHWFFTSEYQDQDGQWIRFMNGQQVRTKSQNQSLNAKG